jgi:Ran GTPase-activating protein (RanGAP) involved in mRNA processing and transport
VSAVGALPGLPPLDGGGGAALPIGRPPQGVATAKVTTTTTQDLPGLPALGSMATPAAVPAVAASSSAALPGLPSLDSMRGGDASALPELGSLTPSSRKAPKKQEKTMIEQDLGTLAPLVVKPIREQDWSGAAEDRLPEPMKPPVLPTKELRAGAPQTQVQVSLLDGTSTHVATTDDFTGADLLLNFAAQLTLWQSEYFHLATANADGEDRWVNPSATLRSQGIGSSTPCVLKVRYFKTPWRLVDPQALYVFFLQVRMSVLFGLWAASSRATLRLAAYQLQLYMGDYDEEQQRPGMLIDTIGEYLPASTLAEAQVTPERADMQMLSRWKTMYGTTKDIAAQEYMKLAQQVPTYGATMFAVRDQATAADFDLGIVEDGFVVSPMLEGDAAAPVDARRHRRKWTYHNMRVIVAWKRCKGGMRIDVAEPRQRLKYSCTKQSATSIVELLTGYYNILTFRGLGLLPDVRLSVQVDDFCDPRKYDKPLELSRGGEMRYWSRLETFELAYSKCCKKRNLAPLPSVHRAYRRALDTNQPWRRLDVGDYPVLTESLYALAESLKATADLVPEVPEFFDENIQLDDVVFCGLPLTHRGLEPIKMIVSRNVFKIRHVDLSRCRLGAKGCLALEPALQQNKTIQQITLNDNNITAKGASIIVKSLKHNPVCRRFTMANNNITDRISTLLSVVIKQNPVVTELVLDNNPFRDLGVKTLLATLKFSKTFRWLSLNNCQLGNSGAKELLKWMTEARVIKVLRVAKNGLGPAFASALVEFMGQPNGLLSLSIAKNPKIGAKGLINFANTLAEAKTLVELDISAIPFDKKSTPILCDRVPRAVKLRKLAVAGCFAKFPAGFEPFVQALSGAQLTVVDFSHQDLSSQVPTLVDFLHRRANLSQLIVKDCNLSGACLASLLAAVEPHRALRKLDLSKNKLSSADIGAIASIVEKSRSLFGIMLRHCNISAANVRTLVQAAPANSPMRLVDCAHNRLDHDPNITAIIADAPFRVRYQKLK